MVMKKQTVWLVAMLSLLIVLSVYYMMPGDQAAITELEEEEKNGEEREEGSDSEEGVDDEMALSNLSSDELFTALRMEKEDHISEMKEQLSSIVASSNSTTEEKNIAIDQMHEIQAVAQKESILEKTIQQEKDFQDVLVRKEDDFVLITVIAEELSNVEANHMMQMARDEFGIIDVRVKLQNDQG
ncbi:stage III sporulation protein AH [Halalkalibacillus sediminis]|uniref:Stage III sporulation protein AH n=1 Tax=Halalkalibacillus sediminis TaxID=2018042 RepID=A0A2I0QXC0_9BACI|nr:SpoIIIAH-like family protein [Halalkalibacillus sediminis]PKR78958.1 stage III sporulation protein AH [Halalkalibacillus sediminis]